MIATPKNDQSLLSAMAPPPSMLGRATTHLIVGCAAVGFFACGSTEGDADSSLPASTAGAGGAVFEASAGGASAGSEAGGSVADSGGTGGQEANSGVGGEVSIGGSPDLGAGGSVPDAAGGSPASTTCASLEPLPASTPLDCGQQAELLIESGPSENRVNYIVVGDGYTADQLDGLYIDHVLNMLEHEQGMFGELGEPYRRYSRFINVCALKVESAEGCIDDGDTGEECDTAFNGSGDDASRLGIVSESLVYQKIGELLPEGMDADWVGVTINAGGDNWWNSGGAVMVWNGGFEPQNQAASVALHEGGHAFHALADEYEGTNQNCSSAPELNVSTEGSGDKWSEWLGFDHNPGTGEHGSFEGARYCSTGVYRPTENSEMNLLPDYFNMPSIQKIIHDIYEIVDPFDSYTDNSAELSDPGALQVRLVDPEVTRLSWFVNGVQQEEAENEPCFDLDGLGAGVFNIEARAIDDTPWVRDNRDDLEQTVTWTVTLTQ